MISVCIATHNGEAYLEQQLASILCQLGEDDEVVISDDGSTDKTLSIIEGFEDARLKVHHFAQPRKTKHVHEYVCRNFENALKYAQGDIIFLSDQDDIWLPHKVELCMEALKDHDLLLHEFSHINSSGIITRERHYNGSFRSKNYLLRTGMHYGCAMAFRRCVLDYALPFPRHLLLHDYWLGILAETLGRFVFVDKPLILYRVSGQNTSVTKNSLLFKVQYRIRTICCVLFRVLVFKLGIHHSLANASNNRLRTTVQTSSQN